MVLPRSVLALDPQARSVTVTASHGQTITGTLEDVRLDLPEENLAKHVVDFIDEKQARIDDVLESDTDSDDPDPDPDEDNHSSEKDAEFNGDVDLIQPEVGDQIEVFWPLDAQYYPGTVCEIDDGRHTISYDDGDT